MKTEIDNLIEKLVAVQGALSLLPHDPGPIREIRINTQQSLRFVTKLEDDYLCATCGEDLGDEPVFDYYKRQIHERCRHSLVES